MASVQFLRDAWSGARRTTQEIHIPPARCIVKMDTPDDDPTLILQQLIPVGSPYPKPSFPAYASGYEIGEPQGYMAYHASVIYRTLVLGTGGWRRSVRGFLDTQRIFETIEPNEQDQKVIGPYAYEPYPHPSTLPNPEFFIDGLPGPGPSRVDLIRIPDGSDYRRVAEGADVPYPSFSIYYSRDDLNDVPLSLIGAAGTMLGMVNSVNFVGEFPIPGTVLFAELVHDQRVGILENSTEPQDGIIDSIQLRFDFKLDRFSPLRLAHWRENDKGDRAFVRMVSNSQIVIEEFKVLRDGDLNNIFGLFNP